MDRRGFFRAGGAGFLGAAFLESALAGTVPTGLLETGDELQIPDFYQLTRKYPTNEIAEVYSDIVPRGGESSPLLPPHVLLFYDTMLEKFINPRKIEPTLAPSKYALDIVLRSFNVSGEYFSQLQRIDDKRDLQLAIKISAPQTRGLQDSLHWFFMNAIDIFLQKKENRKKRLTTFFKNNEPTAALQSQSRIAIPEGYVDLQLLAAGQKKTGFWSKFLSLFTKAAGTPIFASLGIPSLVLDSLKFVNRTLNIFNSQEELLPIWQTQSIRFGIHTGVSGAEFKIRPGYWATMDTTYARKTNMLEDHKLDLDYMTWEITLNGKPVDATYLVSRFDFNQMA